MSDISMTVELELPFAQKSDIKPHRAPDTWPIGVISNTSTPTVTFRSVSVLVRGLGQSRVSTFLSVLQTLNFFQRRPSPKRLILQCISGQVCPGEMLLVLGRPGSGCTTLLKVLSGQVDEYEEVEGDVRYPMDWIKSDDPRAIRNKLVMSDEDDQHFPTLTVEQTIQFAATSKVPRHVPADSNGQRKYAESLVTSILTPLGINHTRQTIVGNDFVRGVSGGERRRVSLAEVMATDAPLQCWDNSTRGLDAANALRFARILRASADSKGTAVVSTLYQAGNEILRQFDKVLVLAEGRQIYYGPASDAKPYFEQMGFVCDAGANISDFLTSVTVISERQIRPGYASAIPTTPAEFEARFKSSHAYSAAMRRELHTSSGTQPIERHLPSPQSSAQAMILGRLRCIYRHLAPWPFLNSEVYTSTFLEQVFASSKRQLRIVRGDWRSMLLQLCASIVIALITGSLYLELPANSNYLFAKTGALCFPILYFAMTRMSETTASFRGRPLISRQKRLAINSPSAHAVALALVDIPIVSIVYGVFHIIYYFMVGFHRDAEKFFVTLLTLILFTLAFGSMYRMIGAWCRHPGVAFQINGSISTMFLVYIGYMIPLKNIPVWLRWVAWMNPAVYAYNAIMSNEMSDRTFQCVAPQYVPYGPEYESYSKYRACSTVGSGGGPTVNGEIFVSETYWAGSRYMWTNVLILAAFWIGFAVMTAIGYELRLQQDNGSEVLFIRRKKTPAREYTRDLDQSDTGIDEEKSVDSVAAQPKRKETYFTFKNISYFIKHGETELQLLHNVSGFVKPGRLVALMGSSGAGKTTLMDVLAQRKDVGRITGTILLDGKQQDVSFQRKTGYCAQSDIHEPTATVFESLMFSARLRQPYDTPDEEKILFVKQVMEDLELTPLQNAIVGNPTSGLSIEQRKRLTIATELVAKPTLLFLDEPTSGLDGQSAYRLCRLLRQLTKAGQTIICTIHQPSASLFRNFDDLLLLMRDGKTAYFGPIGSNAAQVLEYFERHGAPCPPGANPADFLIDVVQSCPHPTVDWHDHWTASKEIRCTTESIDAINAHVVDVQTQDGDVLNGSDTDARQRSTNSSFATPLLYQIFIVTRRQAFALWRNPDYVWNKIMLHVLNGLFGGFTFWKLGNGIFDMQLHLMAIFNFITIAPGCINQLQPLFIQNRDIFEAREKGSKIYHWSAFVAAQNLSEMPLLVLCGTLVFLCWYFAVGFPLEPNVAGQVYMQMLLFEGLFTSIGQAIAVCSPNAYFSALVNPIIIGSILINFSGVVVPYAQIKAFWRYWLYYLNPFTYLLQGLLTPVLWDLDIQCLEDELTDIPLPPSTRCGNYMAPFLKENGGYVIDPESSLSCAYCPYKTGADYLRSININDSGYGWRGVGITALFCISSFGLIFLIMKIRTRATKVSR